MNELWRYRECTDCLARARAEEQQGRSPYANRSVVQCMNGQDGLCDEHRQARRQASRAAPSDEAGAEVARLRQALEEIAKSCENWAGKFGVASGGEIMI